MLASRKGLEHALQVKKMKPYTWNKSFSLALVSRKWLMEKYSSRIRTTPSYPIKSLKEDIMKEYTVRASRSTLYSVRRDFAKEMLGSEKE